MAKKKHTRLLEILGYKGEYLNKEASLKSVGRALKGVGVGATVGGIGGFTKSYTDLSNNDPNLSFGEKMDKSFKSGAKGVLYGGGAGAVLGNPVLGAKDKFMSAKNKMTDVANRTFNKQAEEDDKCASQIISELYEKMMKLDDITCEECKFEGQPLHDGRCPECGTIGGIKRISVPNQKNTRDELYDVHKSKTELLRDMEVSLSQEGDFYE